MNIAEILAQELEIKQSQIEKTIALIDEGNTIPFIARYRKEVTGSLDDSVLRKLSERLTYLRGLEKRRDEISALIDGQGKLTEEITSALDAAQTLTELEDIYRPYKQHRKTRASVARARGLEPLAKLLLEQRRSYGKTLDEIASEYVSDDGEVPDADAALAGARDIIAEDISDNAEYRRRIRSITWRFGTIDTKQIKEGSSPYEMYYDHSERLSSVPNHRVLAINRAEKEEYIRVSVSVEVSEVIGYLEKQLLGAP